MKNFKTLTDLSHLEDQDLIDGFNQLGIDHNIDLTRCMDMYEIRTTLGLH